jgi:hypothetical protein
MSKMNRLVENLSLLMENKIKEIDRKTVESIKMTGKDGKKFTIPKGTRIVKVEFAEGATPAMSKPHSERKCRIYYVKKDNSIGSFVSKIQYLVDYLGLEPSSDADKMILSGKAETIFGDPIGAEELDADLVPSWPLYYGIDYINLVRKEAEKLNSKKSLETPAWHSDKDVKSGDVEMHSDISGWKPSEKGHYRKSDLQWAGALLKAMKGFAPLLKTAMGRLVGEKNNFGTKYDLSKSKSAFHGTDEDVIAKSLAAEFYASSKREIKDFVYAAMVDMAHEMIESFHENDFVDKDDLFKEIGKISDSDRYNAAKAVQWLTKTRDTLKELYDVVEEHFGKKKKGAKTEASQKEIGSAVKAITQMVKFSGKPEGIADLVDTTLFQPKGYSMKKNILDYFIKNDEVAKVVNKPVDKNRTIASERSVGSYGVD